MFLESHAHRALVGGKALGEGEALDDGAEFFQTGGAGGLDGHGALEIRQTQAAAGASPAGW